MQTFLLPPSSSTCNSIQEAERWSTEDQEERHPLPILSEERSFSRANVRKVQELGKHDREGQVKKGDRSRKGRPSARYKGKHTSSLYAPAEEKSR